MAELSVPPSTLVLLPIAPRSASILNSIRVAPNVLGVEQGLGVHYPWSSSTTLFCNTCFSCQSCRERDEKLLYVRSSFGTATVTKYGQVDADSPVRVYQLLYLQVLGSYSYGDRLPGSRSLLVARLLTN